MASGGTRLRRRTSSRAMPSSSAMRSSRRSITKVPCGRPAPRGEVAATMLVRQGGPSGARGGRHFEREGRKHVGADEVRGGVLRQRQAGRREGAVVVTEMAAHREKLAVSARRRLDLPVLHALVVGGGEAFSAILDPFDGTFEQ